ILTSAAWVAGKVHLWQVLAALVAAGVLWGLYFALGFRAFLHGRHANGLGMLLTLGLSLMTYALHQMGFPLLAGLLPPGGVYYPMTGAPLLSWIWGPIVAAAAAVLLIRQARTRCTGALRQWYDLHHGQKVLD